MSIDKESDRVVLGASNGNPEQTNYISCDTSKVTGQGEAINDNHEGNSNEEQSEKKCSAQKLENQEKSPASNPANGGIEERHAAADNLLPANAPGRSQSQSPPSSGKAFLPHNSMHQDNEDSSCSATSSTTSSVRLSKAKPTVGVAPTFRSSERAEKRKEYYAKLEEKNLALEAERKEQEDRMKEEQETALKQLRKKLFVKANPVPSFYYEAPPPKAELKKVPPTRAKSPNFGRRKSFGDANITEGKKRDGICGRLHRHSLGIGKEATNKLQGNLKNGNAVKVKASPKSTKESPKAVVKEEPERPEESPEAAADQAYDQTATGVAIET